MTFDARQIEQLKAAHKQFDDAVHHERIRSASRWLTEQVVGIYESATGSHLNHNFSCSVCVLNIYKHIGHFYFKDLEELEANEKSEVVEIVEDKNTTNKKNDKKRNKKAS